MPADGREYISQLQPILKRRSLACAALTLASAVRRMLAPVIAALGTDQQAEAATTLCNLAGTHSAFVREGGLVPLIKLAASGTDEQKQAAARALYNLATNDDNRVAVVRAGALVPLIKLVAIGTDGQKEAAAGALRYLAVNDDSQVAIACAGGLAPLIELAASGTDEQKQTAAEALCNLATNDDNKVAVVREGGLAPLIKLAASGTDEQKVAAAEALCILAHNDGNKVAVVREGGLAPLIKLAASGTSDEQKQMAAEALCILAFNADNKVAVVREGGLAPLIKLATSGTDEQKEAAAEALRSLAHNDDNKVAVVLVAGLTPLIKLVASGTDEQKEAAARALRYLGFNDDNEVAVVREGELAPLIKLVASGTGEQKEAAAEALRILADNADNKVAIVCEGGLAPLIELAASGTDEQKEAAAGALRNLAVNAANQVAEVREGGLAPLIKLVASGTDKQKEAAAGALHNLTFNADNKVAVVREGGLAPLIELAATGTDEQKVAAAGALGNLAANTANQVAVVREGGLTPLIELAASGTNEQKEAAAGALHTVIEWQAATYIEARVRGMLARLHNKVAPESHAEQNREMEAAMYESGLSHLRKQLLLKVCVVWLNGHAQLHLPNGVEHASELPDMPWAIDIKDAVQLRATEPSVARGPAPELELELRLEELIPPFARPEGMLPGEHVLGDGAFGAVYLARRRGLKVAAKTLHALLNPAAYGLDDPRAMATVVAEVMAEVNVLVKCDHVNIIKFAGVVFTTRGTTVVPKWILSEYASGGTLHARMYAAQPLSSALMTKYTTEAMRALQYLHDDLRTVHCDIKPKNVLLSIDGRIKLGDLGIAKICQRLPQDGQESVYGDAGAAGGTPIYNSPECSFAGEIWGTPRDVYAWGIVMAEMIVRDSPSHWRRLPVDDQREGHAHFTGRAIPRAGGLLGNIISDCTCEVARNRPSAAQLISRLPYLPT